MLTLKRLHQCPLEDAVRAYNRGFEGYFFDQSKTVDSFVLKMGKEELSPTHSVVAFENNEPVGIVLSGIWQRNGKKVAWNGGTGVAPEYRRQGVAQALMLESLNIYREQGVEFAALVAIRENLKAISLYEKLGFQIMDQSIFLENKEALSSFIGLAEADYRMEHGTPQDVYNLPFWSNKFWDIQWKTIEDKEALLVLDRKNRVVGYALYRRIFDQSGKPVTTLLFQCEANPEREDGKSIIQYALNQVFAPLTASFHRLTVNLPVTNQLVTSVLQEGGFTRMAEQVFMTKEMGLEE